MQVYTAHADHAPLMCELVACAQEAEQAGEGTYLGWECRLIYNGRNRLYRLTNGDGGDYVLKCFGALPLPRRWYYGWIGSSKAARSYHNALELERMGLGTATPMGYVEQYDALHLLSRSYYITRWVETTERRIHPHMLGQCTPVGFLEALVDYLIAVHRSGVCHHDLSPGNILYRYDRPDRSYHFSLVDLNRMTLVGRPLTMQEVAHNMPALACNLSVSTQLAELYARKVGYPVADFVQLVNEQTDRYELSRLFKRSYRYARRVRGQSLVGFSLQYLHYRAVRLCRRLTSGVRAERLHALEEELYRATCAQADAGRHALRKRHGYSYRLAPEELC